MQGDQELMTVMLQYMQALCCSWREGCGPLLGPEMQTLLNPIAVVEPGVRRMALSVVYGAMVAAAEDTTVCCRPASISSF